MTEVVTFVFVNRYMEQYRSLYSHKIVNKDTNYGTQNGEIG